MRVISMTIVLLSAANAVATPKTFKHDQFAADAATAAGEIAGLELTAQPGYAQGEAFGQIYEPNGDNYPVEIHGFDLVLAPPPLAPELTANAVIEIYNSAASGPDPGNAPIFSVSTADLFDTVSMEYGYPLVGGAAMSVDFDWTGEPSDHPPVITSGKIWLMIRFTDLASDLSAEWGTASCSQAVGCGCQNVGTLHDTATTSSVNVINYLTTGCTGTAASWAFTESLFIPGDYIVRMRTEVAGGTCTPDCAGAECGDDGCGGSCGTCGGGTACDAGSCVACTADCTGRECGSDGCGGTCGSCNTAAGESCVAGACQTGGGGDCTLNSDCLNGTYCGSAGVCTFDCRIDTDCTSGMTCDALGRCAAGDPQPEDGGCSCGASAAGFGWVLLVVVLRRRRYQS